MEVYNRSSLFSSGVELSNVHNKFDYIDLNSQREDNFSASSNLSLMNTTLAPQTLRDEYLAKIEQSVLAIIFILTIAGNFLVLMGIYLRKQKMTRMYYFIAHLAIADLTTAFFQVLTQLAWEITYRFQGGPFWCKFVKYTQILGPYSSSYILVMTALDRYQAICYPLSNCNWTARRSKFMLGSAWILSFACCLPQLYIFSYQEVEGTGVFDCWGTFEPKWGEKAYITWYCISVFIIPLIILIFAYTCITRVIWLNFTMKNNAFIQEQRVSKTREDSDEVDEHEFDQSIEENDSVFHENCKNSEKTLNDRKMLSVSMRGGGVVVDNSHRPKNLEVSWHQSKSGTNTTRTSMSSKLDPPSEVSSSIITYNKCQSNFSPELAHHTKEGSDDYSEETPVSSLLNSSSHKDKEHGGATSNIIQCVSAHDAPTNCVDHHHSTVHFQTTPPGSDMSSSKVPQERKSSRSGSTTEKKRHTHTWRTVSMSSATDSVSINRKIRKEVKVDAKKKGGLNLSLLSSNVGGGNQGSGKDLSRRTLSVRSSALSNVSQPRTHSVKGISRAKIKTIKLTVTVICCYIVCSTPFIAALLWSAYDPYAKEHPFFYGPTFAILTLLASLNSCANAWIVLFFNPNLLQSFTKGTCGRVCHLGQHSGAPSSFTGSQRKQLFNNKRLATANMNQRPVTSVTGLSPLMNRFSPSKEYGNNRLNSGGGTDGMELIPPTGTEEGSLSNKKAIVVPLRSSLSSRNGNNYPHRDSATAPIETSFIDI